MTVDWPWVEPTTSELQVLMLVTKWKYTRTIDIKNKQCQRNKKPTVIPSEVETAVVVDCDCTGCQTVPIILEESGKACARHSDGAVTVAAAGVKTIAAAETGWAVAVTPSAILMSTESCRGLELQLCLILFRGGAAMFALLDVWSMSPFSISSRSERWSEVEDAVCNKDGLCSPSLCVEPVDGDLYASTTDTATIASKN